MYPSPLRLGLFAFVPLSVLLPVHAQTYSATYDPAHLPDHTENGQTGTNNCGTGSNQTSSCQNVYINSVSDFCLWAPPEPGPNSVIGNSEEVVVSWCVKSGYGTRVIPPGSIHGAHFVQTPDYIQVTGIGDLTSMNIPPGDAGGELDPHGATGNGNPIGGLIFSGVFNNGQLEQLHEWTNFMSATEFCIRACKNGPGAPAMCQHIYDVMGCGWNMPGNYNPGTFENCHGDSGEPMGVYGTSTFYQGEPATPPPHPAPATSQCTPVSTIGGSVLTASGPTPLPSSPPPSSPTSPRPTATTGNDSNGASALAFGFGSFTFFIGWISIMMV